jgi:hypothetical protein
MRGNWRTVPGVTCRVVVSLVTWTLAGGGWGLLLGGALEAILGQGTDGLFEAVGETSLVATGGALPGLLGFGLVMICAGGTGGAIGGFLSSRAVAAGLVPPPPVRGPGIWYENSPRAGALGGGVGGAVVGPIIGAMCGAGLALDAAFGQEWAYQFVYWLAILGFAAGAACGVVAAGRTLFDALPGATQEYIRLHCLPPWARALRR